MNNSYNPSCYNSSPYNSSPYNSSPYNSSPYKPFFFSDEFIISKNTNEDNIYKINLESSILIKNIKQTKLLVGLITSSKMNEFTFQAYSVTCLSDYIKKTNWSYQKSLQIISSLCKQIQILYKDGYCFYGLDINKIIVINENIFLQLSTEYLVPVKNEYLTLAIPFSKKIFISPEIANINSLPATIHYKSIYYSLSSLCCYLLFNEIKSEPKEYMHSIIGTKLYWFLLRGLEENVEKRTLLYI